MMPPILMTKCFCDITHSYDVTHPCDITKSYDVAYSNYIIHSYDVTHPYVSEIIIMSGIIVT